MTAVGAQAVPRLAAESAQQAVIRVRAAPGPDVFVQSAGCATAVADVSTC